MKYKGHISTESKTATPTRSTKRKKTIEERLTPLSQRIILGLTVFLLMVSMLVANKVMGVDVENGSLDPTVFIKNRQLEEAREKQILEAKETFVRNVPAYEGWCAAGE